MNMLLRFLLLLLTLRQQRLQGVPRPALTGVIENSYRVLPHDMGWRDHLPNYRYLSFIELNVQQWLQQQTMIEGMGWIISSQQMTYLKEVKFLDKMTVKSQVLGWDSKYFYFRHEFFVKNQLTGVALTKFVLVDNNKNVLSTSLLTDKPEQTHPVIDSWLANQQEIKQMTKN